MNIKKHEFVVPNNTMIFPWEADLISATKAALLHEFEIKITLSDYKADAKKVSKHRNLAERWGNIPNYFWYVTFEFDIDPPEYAGWIRIKRKNDNNWPWVVEVKKDAPRLTERKITNWDRRRASISLAFHLTYEYGKILK
jgi:hypothetical protein